MRKPLAAFGVALVVAALALIAAPPTIAAAAPSTEDAAAVAANPADGVLNQGSRTVDFDHGWKFQLVNTANTSDPTGRYGNSANPLAAAPGFDDSAWRSLTLPHDWSIEQVPASNNSNATGYFPGGLGWYRKTFTLPPSMTGQQLSIDFDGVYQNSYVYLNGTLVGNHPYGYTGYSVDVTGRAYTDGTTPNVLAVVVQNLAPSSRWYSGSGITRNVHLTVTDPLRVVRNGVFVTTPDLATTYPSGYADVHVSTQLQHATASATADDVQVVSTVKDASGTAVAARTSPAGSVGGTVASVDTDITVASPHLWSTSDPYLYTLQTDVVVAGRSVDSLVTTFGIRWLVFDPNNGIFINGQHFKLQGVDLHNDQGALGSANNYDALWRQMSILKSEGVNAFRTSHNPPSPEWVDVCQRLGIVMMVEAFDAWGSQKLAQDYHLYFNQWSDYDIAEMVNESKNSPAVIMWSIGNEIPGWTSSGNVAVEQRLIADIKAIDPTRPVVAGSDQYRNVPATGSVAERMLQNLDGLGLNYNPARTVDGLHAKYPTKFFFESESSSEESARGVYQDPDLVNTGENYTPGKRLPSSYDNNLASWTMSNEYGLKKDRDRTFFAGQFIWSGFDYIGEPTPYGQFPVKVSSFGTIDTAGFPKDAYYLFQSQWTVAPMVHVVPMNWTNYDPGQNVEVWANTNQQSVELFLNGVSLGRKSLDSKISADGVTYLETTECSRDDKNYTTGTCPGSYQSPNGSSGKLHLTWDVPFAPGQLVAVAYNGDGVEVARDEVDTAGAPATVTLAPDKTVLAADGKSLSYIAVDVVDAHGVTVPDASNPVTFTVSGSGTFLGADNGKQDDGEAYSATTHNAFNGKVLAIVSAHDATAGPITVTASSPGLTPVTTTLYAVTGAAHGIVGVQPTYQRIPLGAAVNPPSSVTLVYANGATAATDVNWQLPYGAGGLRLPAGVHTITGTLPGHADLVAKAIVTVYQDNSIASYSTAVAVGTPPGLPATVTVLATDGVSRTAAVAWDAVAPDRYAAPGQFQVLGHVDGVAAPALATVRVTDAFTEGNIARSTSSTAPAADAGYSGANASIPAGLLDAITTTGGWSNAYNKSATAVLPAVSVAHANEWVSVSWPNAQRVSSVVPYFTISANRVLPAVVVSSWTPTGWTPVTNQQIQYATTTNTPTTVTFDPVSTTAIRLDLTSPAPGTSTGFLQITELQVPANAVTYNATAALTDLTVNGQTVAGFDPATFGYTVAAKDIPAIAATAADNGTVAITQPLDERGTAVITVTSEDRRHTATYTLTLQPIAPAVVVGSSVTYTNQFTVAGYRPDVHVTGDFACNSQVHINGDVRATGNAYLTNGCTIGGDLWVAGTVTMDSSPTVSGDIVAGGTVRFQSSAHIGGDVHTAGAFTITDGKTVEKVRQSGHLGGQVYAGVAVIAPVVETWTAAAYPADASAITWTQWMNTTATANAAPSWSAGLTGNPGCVMAPWAASVNGNTVTIAESTVVDARELTSGCPLVSLQQMTVRLSADLTLYADAFSSINGLHVVSADGQRHALRLIVAGDHVDAAASGINLSSSTVVDPLITTTVQTPGRVTVQTNSQIGGHVIAGAVSCSGTVQITSTVQ